MEIPRGYQKKMFIVYYVIWRYLKMQHFWGARISAKNLIGGLSCIYTRVKNAFKPLRTIRKKFLLFENYKECALYAILRGKKTHFGAYTEAKKGVVRGQVRSKGSPEDPKKCKSFGAIKKMFIV